MRASLQSIHDMHIALSQQTRMHSMHSTRSKMIRTVAAPRERVIFQGLRLHHQSFCTARTARPLKSPNAPESRLLSVCKAIEVTRTETSSAATSSLEEEVARLKAENAALKKRVADLQKLPSEVTSGTLSVPNPVEQLSKVFKFSDGNLKDQLQAGIKWPTKGEKFWERAPRTEELSLPDTTAPKVAVPRDARPLQVVHITAEMAPLAKVGGLGDVVTGLARSCIARGHDVRVFLPFYECLDTDQIEDLHHEADFMVPKGFYWDGELRTGDLKTSVYWGRIGGCPTYLVRPADWNACNIFRGGKIYGGSYNEMEAYLFFSRACLEFLKVTNQQPHIIHLHEWQSCAASMLFWQVYNPSGDQRTRLVLTIHNMDNTGECRQDEFGLSGYPGEVFASIDKALDERTIGHNPERLNLMKGGIVYCNAITTVSPTYVKEILDGGAAGWLRGTLGRPEIRSKFHGILNGIDTLDWCPATDPWLPANYNVEHMDGKPMCKEFLQKGLGLDVDPKKPLLAVISRLVPQKGIHLIKAAIYRTIQQGGQFVLLGSGHADGVFKQLAVGEFQDHPDVKLLIMYSEKLAHQIYAASDMVLVPSMFEPCGLTQMIAMRYGSVPVVRRTGGLADTVTDVAQAPEGEGNGYGFDGVDENSLYGALDRAMSDYINRPDWWRELSVHNMQVDLSWNSSAGSYVSVYNAVG